jgi:hypothetical protein
MRASVGPGRRVAILGSLLVLCVVPPPARAESLPPVAPVFQVHISHGATAGTVQRTLEGAFVRLGRTGCQQIFEEFHDGAGRPLQAALDDLGMTGQGYLGLVIFYDGSRHARCTIEGNLAVAFIGMRIVYVCPEQFRRKAWRDPGLAESIVIHEMLHSLGLGENPPSSQEITSRVTKRCGR